MTRDGMTRDLSFRWLTLMLSVTRFFLRRVTWAVAGVFILTSAHAQETTLRSVYIAGSGNEALDQHVQGLLEERLGDGYTLMPIADEQIPMVEETPVISIGPSAFSRVRQANRSVPILAMLVEKSFIDGFSEIAPGQISGVFYDVPLLRQALTGKAILPHANTIAILATTNSVELYEPLIDELPAYGMTARVFVVDNNEDLIPALVRALGYGDFLLAATDDAIYNPRTIKHILLTAYRRNKIVIGPSQAYVKAGALASSYAPFPAMADQGARFIEQFFETGSFPEPAYSPVFRVEVNDQVARSLNIPVPERDYINQSVQDRLTGNGGLNGE